MVAPVLRHIIICVAVTISGLSCNTTSSEVEPLRKTDNPVIEVGSHNGSNSTFELTLSTEESYGCGAELARKLNRTMAGVSVEIIGVIPGDPGCIGRGAEPLRESIRLRFESAITLNIRHRREVDRYRLELDGNGWQVSMLRSELGSVLTAASPD